MVTRRRRKAGRKPHNLEDALAFRLKNLKVVRASVVEGLRAMDIRIAETQKELAAEFFKGVKGRPR